MTVNVSMLSQNESVTSDSDSEAKYSGKLDKSVEELFEYNSDDNSDIEYIEGRTRQAIADEI